MAMRQDKEKRMMAAYGGFRGSRTVSDIQALIPDRAWETMTGEQLGLMMQAISASYHKGRASMGGLDLCDDAVWFPASMIGGDGALISIEDIRANYGPKEN